VRAVRAQAGLLKTVVSMVSIFRIAGRQEWKGMFNFDEEKIFTSKKCLCQGQRGGRRGVPDGEFLLFTHYSLLTTVY